MSTTQPKNPPKSPVALLVEELVIDLAITATIVAGLVLLIGWPLAEVATSPIFIVLVAGSLIHIGYKYVTRRAKARE